MFAGENVNECLVWLETDDDLDNLKRLVLLFDRVYYLSPESRIVTEDALNDPSRVQFSDSGLELVDFNFFRDTQRGLSAIVEDSVGFPNLSAELTAFREAGVVVEVDEEAIGNYDAFERVRELCTAQAMVDEAYLALIDELGGADELTIYPLGVKSEDGVGVTLYMVDSPTALDDIWEVCTQLFMSHEMGWAPVFINRRRQQVVRFRMEQYKNRLPEFQKTYDELNIPFRFSSAFGEVSFNVASSIISSDLVKDRPAEAILRYREEMREARAQYISNDLTELAHITMENPWGKGAELEVRKYISGKLARDILAYDIECRDVWRKLYGSIPTHIAEVTSKSVIGGVAGGVLGTITATHGWPLLLAGALVGAVAQAPKVVKEITDAILESGKKKRSPIAYVSRLRS